MTVVFTSLRLGIAICQQADGSYSCSGQYNGASIKQAIPAGDGKRCILLLDPNAASGPAFEDVLCVDRKGHLVWTAKLPTSHDVFTGMAPVREGISANTWSGFNILLDSHTGAELKRTFTK